MIEQEAKVSKSHKNRLSNIFDIDLDVGLNMHVPIVLAV